MKAKTSLKINCALFFIFLFAIESKNTLACSTFKLHKGNELIYGHNLNEADLDVPGMVFINKRGIFKNGRTFSEMINKDRLNPSTFSWISRYGSVTFNCFGIDFPDGGMNEVGLYIWEMNEDASFPNDKNLPKLMHMNWMQFVLDSYSTLDEAIKSASEFQLDDGGMTWHYFISDSKGNCASLAFIDGKVKVNTGENMPVTALFNTPYDREMEILKYYKGFGGLYDINLSDPRVPRFVKAAALVRDYDPSKDAVKYGFEMLHYLTVDNEPEWSILFDANRRNVYFKTRINPQIKSFSMDSFDFSNSSAVQILDIDTKDGGDVLNRFQTYTNELVKSFLATKLKAVIPKEFYAAGGLTFEEFIDRFANHDITAELPESQYFSGVWKTKPASEEDEIEFEIRFKVNENAVSGEIAFKSRVAPYPIDHLTLCGNNLVFTYKNRNASIIEVNAFFESDKLQAHLLTAEDDLGHFTLIKQK